jgi:hypothetical protein
MEPFLIQSLSPTGITLVWNLNGGAETAAAWRYESQLRGDCPFVVEHCPGH